jgi:hypothetical protein
VDRASDTILVRTCNCLNGLWKVINRERLHRRASRSHPRTYMNDSLELLYSLFDVLCPKVHSRSPQTWRRERSSTRHMT